MSSAPHPLYPCPPLLKERGTGGEVHPSRVAMTQPRALRTMLAVNRTDKCCAQSLYYTTFYAVNALLVINEIQTKSHSATKSQFSMHFVKTGKYDKKYGQLFSELFDWRQKVILY